MVGSRLTARFLVAVTLTLGQLACGVEEPEVERHDFEPADLVTLLDQKLERRLLASIQASGEGLETEPEDRSGVTISRGTLAGPVARVDRGNIYLPWGARVEYPVELTGPASIEIERLQNRGRVKGTLRVGWTPGDSEPQLLAEYSPGGGLKIRLPSNGLTVGRLSLTAHGWGEPEEFSDGMLIFNPFLVPSQGRPPLETGARAGSAAPPTIVIYLIDALRADHVGCYGYEGGTTPFIDSFADESAVFVNAQAQSPWTRSSVASVMTGLTPQVHSANDDDQGLADEITTLAELLGGAGYRTMAVTGNSNAGPSAGFSQGFDDFIHLRKNGRKVPRSSEIHQVIVDLLDRDDIPRQPLFLFVHTVDPHAPYAPPEPFRSRFAASVTNPKLGSIKSILRLDEEDSPSAAAIAGLRQLYDAEIAANDDSFGRLVALLRSRQLFDQTLLILLSDHGEEFYDHGGSTHGRTLYTEMLDVPLVIKLPEAGGHGIRVDEVVQHIDILPTVTGLVGIETPPRCRGTGLMPLLRESRRSDPFRVATAHLDLRGRQMTSLLYGRWKLMQRLRDGDRQPPRLYELTVDPEEEDDIATAKPAVVRILLDRLHAEQTLDGEGYAAPLLGPSEKKEMRQQLEALGYLEDLHEE